ncbi:non-canonical purine NTP pyrophosphatase [Streptomyces sp. NPDC007095]|uniref:non-canonical purine NTP pyrophosphatase n=1 Tax=Streptomyces sp. NPDC007095 TaxID=3154482 RepID=UPI003408C889
MPGIKVAMCTGNSGKFRTAQEHLAPWGIEVEQVALELDEIQTTSVAEIAQHKARQAFAVLGRPLFVEDSGFYIEEFGGGRGPWSSKPSKPSGPADSRTSQTSRRNGRAVSRVPPCTSTREASSTPSRTTPGSRAPSPLPPIAVMGRGPGRICGRSSSPRAPRRHSRPCRPLTRNRCSPSGGRSAFAPASPRASRKICAGDSATGTRRHSARARSIWPTSRVLDGGGAGAQGR